MIFKYKGFSLEYSFNEVNSTESFTLRLDDKLIHRVVNRESKEGNFINVLRKALGFSGNKFLRDFSSIGLIEYYDELVEISENIYLCKEDLVYADVHGDVLHFKKDIIYPVNIFTKESDVVLIGEQGPFSINGEEDYSNYFKKL